MLRKDDEYVLRRAFLFEIDGQRQKGRQRASWKRQVKGERTMICLSREDTLCRLNWID